MRIVRARPEDAFVLGALSLQLARAAGAEREEGYLDRAADHWLAHHDRLPSWIAEHEGAHAGYLQAVTLPETTRPRQPVGTRGRLWVDALFVAPDHRRRGVATALLTACESWAKGAGVRVIGLRCTPGAEEFCEAVGFAPAAGVREKFL